MPEIDFQLKAALTYLEGGEVLAECLGTPDISVLDGDLESAVKGLMKRVREELEGNGPGMLERFASPTDYLLDKVTIEVRPDTDSEQWRKPVFLTLDVILWRRSEKLLMARVPALGIEVGATDEERMKIVLPGHIRFALQRLEAFSSMERLVHLERVQRVEFAEAMIKASVRTPIEEGNLLGDEKKDQKPALDESADKLAEKGIQGGLLLDEDVAKLAELLGGRFPTSVVLVGPSGVGKTTLFRELSRQRKKRGLGEYEFYETSGSRLIAGKTGFGVWQEHCGKFCSELSKKRAIVHLGNLFELGNVGASVHNAMNIAAFFRPHISRGDVLAVAELTEDEVALLERTQPALLNAFHRIDLKEPNDEKLKFILELRVKQRSKTGIKMDAETLEQITRLHRRFATYSASPGRPMRFLDNLLNNRSLAEKKPKKGAKNKAKVALKLDESDVTKAFSDETGLPRFILDDEVALDLDDAKQDFESNVMGQGEAVDRVIDVVASIKTRLSRPDKPFASFLFIGPTGVGKTELAKQIARYLFGNENRIVRFDMSEFSDPVAVNRLIGTAVNSGEGLLTAKLREQPFSVVLLDEFEKADSSFFDLLLQILGEGRLTDGRGRLADFRNAVVVMTSNLGADSFGKSIEGFGDSSMSPDNAREHFEGEVKRFLRPEIFNRIDRVIPFAPLSGETALAVTRKELNRVQRRDGVVMRKLQLDYTDEVVAWLASKGLDPRYGARPLKRMIEQKLLAPLAAELNGRTESHVLSVHADLREDNIRLRVGLAKDDSGRNLSNIASGSPTAVIAEEAAALRWKAQALCRSSAAKALEDSISFLNSLKRRLDKKGFVSDEDKEKLKQLPKFEKTLKELELFFSDVCSLEDDVIGGIHMGKEVDAAKTTKEKERLLQTLFKIARVLLGSRVELPDEVSLVLISGDEPTLHRMIRFYRSLVQKLKGRVKMDAVFLVDEEESGEQSIDLKKGVTLTEVKKGCDAVLLNITGDLIQVLLVQEARLHEFQSLNQRTRCRVLHGVDLGEEGALKKIVQRADTYLNDGTVRRYDERKGIVDDPVLGRFRADDEEYSEVIAEACKKELNRQLEQLTETKGEA